MLVNTMFVLYRKLYRIYKSFNRLQFIVKWIITYINKQQQQQNVQLKNQQSNIRNRLIVRIGKKAKEKKKGSTSEPFFPWKKKVSRG